MKEWRDVGAVDKADNIVRLWKETGQRGRPRVVEIGCGDGAVGSRLAELDFFESYVGFDLSPGGIAEASQRGVPAATFAVVDSDRMPVADDSADLVILSHVIEHLEHPRTLLYEARRIAPLTLVEVPLEHHLRQPRDFEWNDLGHINAYTAKSIRRLLQSCNLEVMRQQTSNPGMTVATFYQNNVRRRMSWRFKHASLKIAPGLARGMFTYHETLMGHRTGSQ